jgi:hypothetical protein
LLLDSDQILTGLVNSLEQTGSPDFLKMGLIERLFALRTEVENSLLGFLDSFVEVPALALPPGQGEALFLQFLLHLPDRAVGTGCLILQRVD